MKNLIILLILVSMQIKAAPWYYGSGEVVSLENVLAFDKDSDVKLEASAGNFFISASDTVIVISKNDTVVPASSALFDVQSTTKGGRPCPNMTTTQRDAINSPVEGLCVFNTTTGVQNHFDGTAWIAAASGGAVSIAYLKEILAPATSNGTFTSGSYITRVINTLEGDTSFISLSSNQFTLDPGTYYIHSMSPGYNVNEHKSVIYSITDSAIEPTLVGGTARAAGNSQTVSIIVGRLIVSSTEVFEVRHRSAATFSTGLGVSQGGFTAASSVYLQVMVMKID